MSPYAANPIEAVSRKTGGNGLSPHGWDSPHAEKIVGSLNPSETFVDKSIRHPFPLPTSSNQVVSETVLVKPALLLRKTSSEHKDLDESLRPDVGPPRQRRKLDDAGSYHFVLCIDVGRDATCA